MNETEYSEMIYEVIERNAFKMENYAKAVMRVFCCESRLQKLYDYFSDEKNMNADPYCNEFSISGINKKYLDYAISIRIAHLILFSCKINDEEEYDELLAGVDAAMAEMGFCAKDRLRMFQDAETEA